MNCRHSATLWRNGFFVSLLMARPKAAASRSAVAVEPGRRRAAARARGRPLSNCRRGARRESGRRGSTQGRPLPAPPRAAPAANRRPPRARPLADGGRALARGPARGARAAPVRGMRGAGGAPLPYRPRRCRGATAPGRRAAPRTYGTPGRPSRLGTSLKRATVPRASVKERSTRKQGIARDVSITRLPGA